MLFPSFLCLDAPLAATGWAMCLSLDCAGAGLRTAPTLNLIALFLGVWSIYLFDRILDVSRTSSPEFLTARHRWAGENFTLMASLGAATLGLLALAILPRLEIRTLLAGIAPGLITLFYYLVFRFSRITPGAWKLPYKEITVAICFALGIWIAAMMEPDGIVPLFLTGGLVLLFFGNCLFIARAERDLDRRHDPAAHFARASGGGKSRLPEIVLALATISSLPLLAFGKFPLSSSGLLVCSALTLLLASSEGGRGPDFTQSKADGILMIPLLFGLSKALILR